MNPLPLSEATNPDAIKIHVAQKIELAPTVPTSSDLSSILLSCMMMPEDLVIPEEKQPFLMKIIKSRIWACFTFEIKEERLILFLSVVAENPGTAIMYLWYLQYWACKNNKRIITFDDICMTIFPKGFPTEKSMQEIWDGQKIQRKRDDSMGSDNLVDYSSAGESILFKDTVHKEQKNQ